MPAPLILKIPVYFERQFRNMLLEDDFERILCMLGRKTREQTDPTYIDYIIYMLLELNILSLSYSKIIENLDRYSLEKFKRFHIRNIDNLRRCFIRMLSSSEHDFMRKYGLDNTWLRIKILSRSPSMGLDNEYYRIIINEVRSSISKIIYENYNHEALKRVIRFSIRLGIELNLLMAWYLTYFIMSSYLSQTILDRYINELIYAVGSINPEGLLTRLASFYEYSVSKLIGNLHNFFKIYSKYIDIKLISKPKFHIRARVSGCLFRHIQAIIAKDIFKTDNVSIGSELTCVPCLLIWKLIYKRTSNISDLNSIPIITSKSDHNCDLTIGLRIKSAEHPSSLLI